MYPPLKEAMEEALLQEVDTYVSCRQNIVTQFIANRPHVYLCLALMRRPGSRSAKQWWEQYSLDLEGMRTTDW